MLKFYRTFLGHFQPAEVAGDHGDEVHVVGVGPVLVQVLLLLLVLLLLGVEPPPGGNISLEGLLHHFPITKAMGKSLKSRCLTR